MLFGKISLELVASPARKMSNLYANENIFDGILHIK